jgi:hypothetical protein
MLVAKMKDEGSEARHFCALQRPGLINVGKKAFEK